MEDKSENPLFEELLSKRRKLLDLREKAIQSGHPKVEKNVCSDEAEEQPTCTEFLSKPNEAIEGVYEDFDSDDSVKDKTYEPAEDVNSSCSHVSDSPDSVVTKRKKTAVKRQLFSPKKKSHRQLKNSDFITPEDLFGPQEQLHSPSHILGSFNDYNIRSNFSNESTPLKHKNSYIVTKALVHFNGKIDDSCNDSVSATFDAINGRPYGTMTVDGSGVVYFSNISPHSHKTEENGQVFSTKKSSRKRMESENNLDLIIPYEDDPDLSNIVQKKNNLDATNDKPSYGIMTVDKNGVVYLSNISQNNYLFTNEHQSVQEPDTPLKPKGRKRDKNPLKWKRTASKLARLKGSPYHSTVAKKKPEVEGRQVKPPCSCRAKCYEKLSEEERQTIFEPFWKKCRNWDQRRQFITDSVTKTKKRLMKTDANFDTDKRKFSYTYRLTASFKTLKVCRVMFLNTLSIGDKFVKVSFGKQLDGGMTEGDKRGKHVPANKTPEPIVKSVMDHINSYPSYESHYSRQKSERKFLGPELNISIMFKHYEEMMKEKGTPSNLIAKEWVYRNIFTTKFNLSFKLPSIDTCDDCDSYKRKLEDAQDESERKAIEIEKEAHNKLADERYNFKRTDKAEAVASSGKKKVVMFDLQKCMPTPCLTNAKSFYLRKLWTLNLTIYDTISNTAANMLWSENIGGRGGNEIASCLIRWAEENSASLSGVKDLTLWSDNCPGQNRNLMIVVGYMWLMHRFPQLRVINHKYMLKGHTHMEVDHIHSQIERKKKLLKTMQIATPRDWSLFIKTCGGKKVFQVHDMELQHFKDVSALYKKDGPFVARKKNKEGHDFKISHCVWLQLKQDQPGILFYKNNFADEFLEISLIRNASKGVLFPVSLPEVRKNEKPISTLKYNDLMALLQWIPRECHQYYKNLKQSNTAPDFPEAD